MFHGWSLRVPDRHGKRKTSSWQGWIPPPPGTTAGDDGVNYSWTKTKGYALSIPWHDILVCVLYFYECLYTVVTLGGRYPASYHWPWWSEAVPCIPFTSLPGKGMKQRVLGRKQGRKNVTFFSFFFQLGALFIYLNPTIQGHQLRQVQYDTIL